jgi:hypothetical protein
LNGKGFGHAGKQIGVKGDAIIRRANRVALDDIAQQHGVVVFVQ